MKKILQLMVVAALTTAFVSSCTMQRRLHNKGFYVSWNSPVKTQKEFNKVTEKAEEMPQAITSTASVALQVDSTKKVAPKQVELAKVTEATQEQVAINRYDVASKEQAVVTTPAVRTTTVSNQQVNATRTFSMPKASNAKQASKAESKFSSAAAAGAAASGGMLVLYIILCLFPLINLIPVYLTDGAVTMNFWLTLILDILGALPGIIFALLVVLGVVSLA